jgi:hypothetical protein
MNSSLEEALFALAVAKPAEKRFDLLDPACHGMERLCPVDASRTERAVSVI